MRSTLFRILFCAVTLFVFLPAGTARADAVDELTRLTKSTNRYVRMDAARELLKYGDPRVPPVIIGLMKSDPEKDVKTSVIYGLYGYQRPVDPAFIGPVMDVFKDDPVKEVRQAAAYTLGNSADARVLPMLIEAAQKGDKDVRCISIGALGNLAKAKVATPQSFDVVMKALGDRKEEAVRSSAALALINFKDAASAAALVGALADEKATIRIYAIGSLGTFAAEGIQSDKAPDALILASQDKSPSVREKAAGALGNYKGEKAVSALTPLLADPYAKVRKAAADAMKKAGYPAEKIVEAAPPPAAAISEIIVLAQDPNPTLRIDAVSELKNFDDPRAVEAIVAALQDKEPGVRVSAVYALAGYGAKNDPRSIEPLQKVLEGEKEPWIRSSAVSALGYINDPRVAPIMVSLLNNEGQDVSVRASAAYFMGEKGDPSLIDTLKKYFSSDDKVLAAACIEAAGKLAVKTRDKGALTAPLTAAQSDDAGRIREAAAGTLFKLNDPACLNAYVKGLADPFSAVRKRSAEAAGYFGSESAVPALFSLLKDQDEYTRSAAKDSLGQLGVSPESIEQGVMSGGDYIATLAEKVRTADQWSKSDPASALGKMTIRRAKDTLVDLALRGGDENIRAAAVSAFTWNRGMPDPRVAETLITALNNDTSQAVREAAAGALGSEEDPRAAKALVDAYAKGDGKMRIAAVRGLQNKLSGKDPAIIDVMVRALGDTEKDARCSAASAFRSFKEPTAVAPLINLLRDEDQYTRECAVIALGENGDTKAVNALMPLLKDKTKSIRDAAQTALKKLGVSDAQLQGAQPKAEELVAALVPKTVTDDSNIYYNAIMEIGRIPDPVAIDALIRIMETHKEWQARGYAATALGNYGPGGGKAMDALVKALREEKKEYVRSNAATALGKYREAQAYDALSVALNDPDADVRKNAADALGNFGDKRAVSILMPLLKDQNEYVIQYAQGALKKLGVSEDALKQAGLTPQDLLARYTAELAKSSWWNDSVRKKIIETAAAVTPPPAVPEEARRSMAQGQAAVKLAKSPADFAEAEKLFEKATLLAPWWADAYFNLGIVKEKAGKVDDAMSCFNLYLAAAPNSPDAETVKSKIYELEYLKKRKADAQAFMDKGNEYLKTNNNTAALTEFKEAVRLDPDSAWAHYFAGYTLGIMERFEESAKECEEAIRLESNHLTMYLSCAYAYGKLGDKTKETQLLEEGLRVDPYGENLAFVHGNLGYNYEREGNNAKAVEHLERAIIHGHPDKDKIQERINNLKR